MIEWSCSDLRVVQVTIALYFRQLEARDSNLGDYSEGYDFGIFIGSAGPINPMMCLIKCLF